MSENTNEKKNVKKKWLLLLLIFLLIFSCVFGYRARVWEIVNPDGDQTETSNQDGSEATNAQSSENGSGNQVNPVVFDEEVFFSGVKFAESPEIDLEFIDSIALADGTGLITFGTGGTALPPGTYTANIDTGEEKLTFECELNGSEASKIFCSGPILAMDTPVVTDFIYTSAGFSLTGNVKKALSEATAGNLVIDFDELNEAAEALGLGEVDNPFEAWGVIGCCIQNVGTDGLPEACEPAIAALLPETEEESGFFDNLQDGFEANPEEAWQNLMDYYNAPQGWSGSPGSLNPTQQEALYEKANACAAALGYPEADGIDDLFESRTLFDLMWAMDPRRSTNDGPGGVMGALHDFFSGIVETFDDVLSIFTGDFDGEWELLSGIESLWDNTFGGLLSTAIYTACLTFSLGDDDPGAAMDSCAFISESLTGTENYWDQFGGESEPPPLPTEMPPQACLDYIDHAKDHTYFAVGSSGSIGNEFAYIGSPMAYCAEAMGFGYTPDEIRPYMDNDYMYDKIIEAYGFVSNPAMPDPCRMVVQWCDSDQYESPLYQSSGQAVAEGTFQGAFAALNGCNDPQSYAEAEAWVGSNEVPDCEAYEAVSDTLSSLTGVDIGTTLYCEGVEAFGDTPVGDVAACAEELGYSGYPMYTVEDYLDFMAWIGMMEATLDVSWSANCQTAIDYANRFGLVEQSIDTAASACSNGGPVQLNTAPVEWVVPELNEDPPGENGGGGSGAASPGGSSDPEPGGDRCSIFDNLENSLTLLDVIPQSAAPTLYVSFPGGVPGLEIDIPGVEGPWEYSATLGEITAKSCDYLGYKGRLYCSFILPSNYMNTVQSLEVFLDGCDQPIVSDEDVNIVKNSGALGSDSSGGGGSSGGSSGGGGGSCAPQACGPGLFWDIGLCMCNAY